MVLQIPTEANMFPVSATKATEDREQWVTTAPPKTMLASYPARHRDYVWGAVLGSKDTGTHPPISSARWQSALHSSLLYSATPQN